ncbi:MAG: DUF2441 domain-containing protein [Chloroflexi bacterium]|nr:MAG: DUF2441 domain-containing protein [Chloroflexota bacterium]
MTKFYTVDRCGTLRAGLAIELVRYTDIKPPELQIHVDEMFPGGVSSHGERYFLKAQQSPKLASPSTEILFEYVRRALYPHRPSRFQSVFAFESKDQAIIFSQKFGSGDEPIWEVEAKESFRGDMNLLTTGPSILVWSYFANKYWKGEPGTDPFWEVLLVPPVHVIHKIQRGQRPH